MFTEQGAFTHEIGERGTPVSFHPCALGYALEFYEEFTLKVEQFVEVRE